jgi:hypothetical protein
MISRIYPNFEAISFLNSRVKWLYLLVVLSDE